MSVSSLHADLRAACRAALVAMMGVSIPAVADWEGQGDGTPFKSPLGTAYFRERLHPMASTPRGIGRGGAVSHRVLLVINLFYPRGVTTQIEAAAGALLGRFTPGAHLVRNTSVGTVVQAERDAIVHEPDWQGLPVKITILAYTAG